MWKGTNIAVGLLLVLAIGIWYFSASFTADSGNGLNSAAFPRAYATILAVLAVVLDYDNNKQRDLRTLFAWESPGLKRAGLVLIVTVLYCIFLSYLGFILLTPVCLIILMLIMDQDKFWTKLLASLSTTALIYLVFEVLLNVQLPSWSF